MYELKRLEWHKLQSENSFSDFNKLFEALVPPAFHCCLQGKDPNDISETSLIAIGALHQGEPVGIVLASCYRHTHYVKVHYIHVLPEHRNHHIARQMLQAVYAVAKDEGGRYFTLIYKLEDPLSRALEKVLIACNWNPAQPFMIECLFECLTFDPPWFKAPYKIPSSIQEFPWSDLTKDEREQILHDERRGVIPLAVLPFRNEHLVEPLNSLGLRYDGRVIGWIITHRTAPDKIVYQALYIERSFHFLGPGIKLLIDSILIQKKVPIKWSAFQLPLTQVHPAWIQFINRRLIPYADEVIHYVQAWR
ncbi:MAG: GNAT family N-acetyltransferase [Parachlamydiaceae bacterium]|nr:GNAT family N-acetyltransferase [Parachlamydiaceae bacterium]